MSVSQDPNIQMKMMNPGNPNQQQVKVQGIPQAQLSPVQQVWAHNFSNVKQISVVTEKKKRYKNCGCCCLEGFNYIHTAKDQTGQEIARFEEVTTFPQYPCCGGCCKGCCSCKWCKCKCDCCQCPDIFVHHYTSRNTTDGHIFNQQATIEIRHGVWGDTTGKLLNGNAIQGISEQNSVVNYNRCKLCMLLPVYSNLSINTSNNNIINRITHSGSTCSSCCKQQLTLRAGVPSDLKELQVDRKAEVHGQKAKNCCKCFGFYGIVDLDVSSAPNEQKPLLLLNLIHSQYDTTWTPPTFRKLLTNKYIRSGDPDDL